MLLTRSLADPLQLSHSLLWLFQTHVWIGELSRVPAGSAIVVSNHRSFLDAPALIAALGRPIHFACHYYLAQVPGVREVVKGLDCIPLQQGRRHQIRFFRQAEERLRQNGSIGLFPDGADTITRPSAPTQVGPFHSGFVHLALHSQVDPLPIVPVAIYVRREWRAPSLPLWLLHGFDTTEPMFQGDGQHPLIIYQEVEMRVADPIWISAAERRLTGSRRNEYVQQVVQHTQSTVQGLLLPSSSSP